MTGIALLPYGVACFAFGVALTWPIAHRSGAKADSRDQAEIGRILTGVDAPFTLDLQELPAPPTAEPGRQQEEEPTHAAPAPPEPNWHRGEHRIYSPGWFVEVAARLLSIGAKPNLPAVGEVEYTPRHGDWRVSTQEIAKVVEEETRRRDDEFEALLYAMVAKGAVLR